MKIPIPKAATHNPLALITPVGAAPLDELAANPLNDCVDPGPTTIPPFLLLLLLEVVSVGIADEAAAAAIVLCISLAINVAAVAFISVLEEVAEMLVLVS